MKKSSALPILIIVLFVLILFGAGYFLMDSYRKPAEKSLGQVSKDKKAAEFLSAPTDSIEQEQLDALAQKTVTDVKIEERLNTNMVMQLRSYQTMLEELQKYAADVEKDIDLIKEISKNEYQEDVALQASLYGGKRPDLVALHLEEFPASRVGAILAKMKEKEASAVLDVWAKKKEPRVSLFYREVMAAYLNNKRRDMHPELFDQVADDSKELPPSPTDRNSP